MNEPAPSPSFHFNFPINRRAEDRFRPVPRTVKCEFKGCSVICNTFEEYSRQSTLHQCSLCGYHGTSVDGHVCYPLVGSETGPLNVDAIQLDHLKIQHRAHMDSVMIFTAEPPETMLMFEEVFSFLNSDMNKLHESLFTIHRNYKIKFTITPKLERISDGYQMSRSFFSPFLMFSHPAFMQTTRNTALKYILKSLELYMTLGSGWKVIGLPKFELHILMSDTTPRVGGLYIKTPKCLRKRSIIKINAGKSRNCFMLSVICSLFREHIYLPEAQGLKWEHLTYNQRRRLKYLWQKH
jgi:hypothetical protein